jgi:hypothetical protein
MLRGARDPSSYGDDDRIGVIVKEQRSGIGHIFHNVH